MLLKTYRIARGRVRNIYDVTCNISGSGGMADAQASGACGSNTVWVQVPSSARFKSKGFIRMDEPFLI